MTEATGKDPGNNPDHDRDPQGHEEIPLCFPCGEDQLIGILHRPARPRRTALVIVVGGPQYRVGSHRQFILLARHLADRGFPVLRFDCRGMGDSSGEFPGFEHVSDDISAACSALHRQLPQTERIALWGLCDAASAALLYTETGVDVAGMALVNPWVRSETTLAQTYLKHYYLQRLLSRDFWQKLFSGGMRIGRVLGDLAGNLRAGSSASRAADQKHYVTRMREGLARFKGDILILLSGNDLTAAEFTDLAGTADWKPLLQRPGITTCRVEDASHTFSTMAWRNEASGATARWLTALDSRRGPSS